ncbi:MAG: hypothetical protein HOE92_06255 [Euryarchaeota archaeon]|jgi:uncharacterized coiled-coil DUF342 family protein|nr:hypothetical protein [Euryarchaeota archaeon]MBT3971801.1 hypothetical protein [Euryarchaeota archaeon]MBT6645405.1 hypothetical protein [Euryarchaeota archaeon]
MATLKDILDEPRKLVDKKATEFRNIRDEWNAKTKEHLIKRNTLNGEVRELIENVKQQREIRERMNEEVRARKSERNVIDKKIREMKDSMNTGKDENKKKDGPRDKKGRPITIHTLRREFERLDREFGMGYHTGKNEKKVMKRMKEIRQQIKTMEKTQAAAEGTDEMKEALSVINAQQEVAHNLVREAASQAQQAHDLMIEWNEQVDARRELAESAHRKLRRSKKEADGTHHSYILSLRCLHSILNMSRAMRERERGAAPTMTAKEGTTDLMQKLMSGHTLSTDELLSLQKF